MSELETPGTLLTALYLCTSKLNELKVSGSKSSSTSSSAIISGSSLLTEVCRRVQSNLKSLQKLILSFPHTQCNVLAIISFLLAVKETNLSSASLELFFSWDDADICPNKLIHAIKSSFHLVEFKCEALPHKGVLSQATWSLCDGILAMNTQGRRYLLLDSRKTEGGAHVLAAVADNLDCLYFHLLENPPLCAKDDSNLDKSPPPAA